MVQPDGSVPCSDAAHCIKGTAVLGAAFGALCPGMPSAHCCPSSTCTGFGVYLFDRYPASAAPPIAEALVAKDDTFTFDGLGAEGGVSSGYYVQATAALGFDGGSSTIATLVGPIALPQTEALAITVLPAHAYAYESRAADAGMTLDWVIARLFDPASGAEITSGATVTLSNGDASTPLAPTVLAPDPTPVWFAALAQPAQPTYTVTAQHPAFDGGIVLQLVADPPAFDGTITSADAGANGALHVVWSPEPQAGYETVTVYPETADGGIVGTAVFASPTPDPAGQTSETTGPLEAGTYVVNVAYTRANCPSSAGGCVQAATVAATTTTVP
jgi:hypothetical protein